MEPGFMLDTMYGGRMEGRWTPGPIETGLLGGVRIGERGAYSVIAYRCVDCGRLELYA
jgi:hypothetical protein